MTGTPLQATAAIPALPDAASVGFALVWFLAGLSVPTRYGIERIEGFGRLVAGKLPYQAPPGKDEETAMQEAVESGPTTTDTEE